MSETIGGRYRLERRLGAGGMGQVWLAHDTQLDRQVALKLLGADADPQRFEREAQAIASLSHPNICRLFDYGSADGRRYMVFEHLPGGTVEDRLAPGKPLDDAESQWIATDVAAGLAHAHGRGLIHRDLKPTNIVFDEEGRAKVTDFGIARVTGADTLTDPGTLMGTAAYMSPEQAQGADVTPATDVYSFGVILYRMLTGRLPFESSSAVEVLRRQLQEAHPPLFALRPEAPAALAAVAESSLAKDPAARPPNGEALVDLLGAAEAPTIVAGAPAVTQVLPRQSSSRRPAWLAALIAVPLLVVVGGALALLVTNDEPRSSPLPGPTQSQTTATTDSTPPPPPEPPPPVPPPPPEPPPPVPPPPPAPEPPPVPPPPPEPPPPEPPPPPVPPPPPPLPPPPPP